MTSARGSLGKCREEGNKARDIGPKTTMLISRNPVSIAEGWAERGGRGPGGHTYVHQAIARGPYILRESSRRPCVVKEGSANTFLFGPDGGGVV